MGELTVEKGCYHVMKFSRAYLWYKLNACRYCSFIDDNSWRFLKKKGRNNILHTTDYLLRMEGNYSAKTAGH